MLSTDAFIAYLDNALAKYHFYLSEWRKRCEHNPTLAFVNSIDAFRDAAYIDVYERVKRMLNDKHKSAKPAAVQDYALSVVISAAKAPSVHNTPTANLYNQYLIAAWTQVLEVLAEPGELAA